MINKIKERQKFEWYLSFHTKKMINRAIEELVPGEKLVGAYLGRIGKVRGVITLTDRRILLTTAGLIGEDVKSILWNNISDIHYNKSLFKGYIEIDLLKDTVQVSTYKKTASKIYKDVRGLFFKGGGIDG